MVCITLLESSVSHCHIPDKLYTSGTVESVRERGEAGRQESRKGRREKGRERRKWEGVSKVGGKGVSEQ